MIIVHSNYWFERKKKDSSKPGYWVTENGKILFETEIGDEAVQWAVDYHISKEMANK